jgi:hypothetical protein
MALLDHQIAVGNNNAAGLVLFTSLTDSDGNRFPAVAGLGTYDPGLPVRRGDYSVSYDGTEYLEWVVQRWFDTQYKAFKTTYVSSSLRVFTAPVTIRTNTELVATFANYNAVLELPTPAELKSVYDPVAAWYETVTLKFWNVGTL